MKENLTFLGILPMSKFRGGQLQRLQCCQSDARLCFKSDAKLQLQKNGTIDNARGSRLPHIAGRH